MKRPVQVLLVLVLSIGVVGRAADEADWRAYGRDPGGTAYSPLNQITTANVTRLRRAWTYHTGESGLWEDTPIVADNLMYFATQRHRVVALDATTGKEMWVVDPKDSRAGKRGVSFWPGDATHGARIFVAGLKLTALDARSGALATDFGDHGSIDMRIGIADKFPDAPYSIVAAPAIYKNLVIVGPALQEGPSKGPGGDPRAFDAVAGKLVWQFHAVPHPGEPGSESWGPDGWRDRSGPSQWGGITIDVERGLAFVPFGNPGDSFYGADRPGSNLYANSVVALDASSWARRWHFQMVHHDIYDFDLSAPPALVDATVNGRRVPAVAAAVKSGLLYILDRESGKPVFGVEERPVPQSTVPGEVSWPTQPFPLKPPPVARLTMTRDEVSNVTPEARAFCLDAFDKLTHRGPFTPLGLEPTLIFPSALGGVGWGGMSFDAGLGYLFINTSNIGQTGQMAAAAPGAPMRYVNRGAYGRFLDPEGHPCNQPPWGEFIAIDLRTGDIAWRKPLGIAEDLEAKGIKNTGAVNLGGSVATAGGLVFIAATNDRRFRAFDSKTGAVVWETVLEGSGNNNPITYRGQDGKQYVALVAGGSGRAARSIGVPAGARVAPEPPADVVAAYALP